MLQELHRPISTAPALKERKTNICTIGHTRMAIQIGPVGSFPDHKGCAAEIPSESCESCGGTLLGGHYKIQRLMLQDDYLDVYTVTDPSGVLFEAQAFSTSCPEGKLLQSRSRRMKRIFRSQNFKRAFTEAGKRFLVSNVERSGAELANLAPQAGGRPHIRNDSLEEAFPPSSAPRCGLWPGEKQQQVRCPAGSVGYSLTRV